MAGQVTATGLRDGPRFIFYSGYVAPLSRQYLRYTRGARSLVTAI